MMSGVGLLIVFAILGAVICAKTRSAAGAVVFSLVALVLFVSTPVGQGLPGVDLGADVGCGPRVDAGVDARVVGVGVGGGGVSGRDRSLRMRGDRGWRSWAACRGVDPDLFFLPDDTDTQDRASGSAGDGAERPAGGRHVRQVAAAKAVCARCSVRQPCLAEALEAMPYGVAGGLDEHERRDLARGGSESGPLRLGAVWPVAATRGEACEAARAAVAEGEDRRWVAVRFGVSVRTVERWIAAAAETDATATAGGPR